MPLFLAQMRSMPPLPLPPPPVPVVPPPAMCTYGAMRIGPAQALFRWKSAICLHCRKGQSTQVAETVEATEIFRQLFDRLLFCHFFQLCRICFFLSAGVGTGSGKFRWQNHRPAFGMWLICSKLLRQRKWYSQRCARPTHGLKREPVLVVAASPSHF